MLHAGLFFIACIVWFGRGSLCFDMDDPCPLEGLFANCYRLVDGVLIEVTALINPCHDPMDVTFLVEAKHPEVNWQHTFISTNLGERVIMPHLGERSDLMLDINMQKSRLSSKNESYNIQVSFVGSRNELLGVFLRADFSPRSTQADCFGDRLELYIKIVVGVSVAAIAVILSAILGSMIYKRKQRKTNAESLVNNMEPQASSTSKAARNGKRGRMTPQVEFRSSGNVNNGDEPVVYLSTGSGIEPMTSISGNLQLV